MAAEIVQHAGQRTEAVASWLEDREPGHVLDEVTRFARQRPGAFLAAAAAAGFLVGRLGRGLKAANDAPSSQSRELTSSPAESTTRAQPYDLHRQAPVAPTAVPPVPAYPPAPAYDTSGYRRPDPTPRVAPPTNYPPPAPGYREESSGRNLAP
jgi:hypothetical protein